MNDTTIKLYEPIVKGACPGWLEEKQIEDIALQVYTKQITIECLISAGKHLKEIGSHEKASTTFHDFICGYMASELLKLR